MINKNDSETIYFNKLYILVFNTFPKLLKSLSFSTFLLLNASFPLDVNFCKIFLLKRLKKNLCVYLIHFQDKITAFFQKKIKIKLKV